MKHLTFSLFILGLCNIAFAARSVECNAYPKAAGASLHLTSDYKRFIGGGSYNYDFIQFTSCKEKNPEEESEHQIICHGKWKYDDSPAEFIVSRQDNGTYIASLKLGKAYGEGTVIMGCLLSHNGLRE